MPLIALLLALAVPLAERVLVGLSIGWISYEIVSTITETVITSVQSAWGGMSSDLLGIVSLAGFPDAIGIILGAYSGRAAIIASQKILGRIAPGAP